MALTDPNGLNSLTWQVIKAAMEVHKQLGPGLLESTYRICLVYELRQLGLSVVSEIKLPVLYKGLSLECGYKLDIAVDSTVIIEIKALAAVAPVHKAQLLTYLRLTGYPVGLLLNFNVPLMKNGITRVLNSKSKQTK